MYVFVRVRASSKGWKGGRNKGAKKDQRDVRGNNENAHGDARKYSRGAKTRSETLDETGRRSESK